MINAYCFYRKYVDMKFCEALLNKQDLDNRSSCQSFVQTIRTLLDINGHKTLDSNYKPIITREYHYTRTDGSKIVIQEHSTGHTYGPPGTQGNQGSHFNTRPYDPESGNGSRNSSVHGASDHYEFPRR